MFDYYTYQQTGNSFTDVSIKRLRPRSRSRSHGSCIHFYGSGSVTSEVNTDQIFSVNASTPENASVPANAQWKQSLRFVIPIGVES